VLNLDANIGSIKVHFDNLLGGGDFGEALNSAISILGKTIWDLVRLGLPKVLHLIFLSYDNSLN